MVEKTKLDWAIETAAHGLPVFPLHYTHPNGDCSCSKGPDCPSKGKHPLTEHGYKEASTDPEVIRAWWKRQPKANIAIHPGKEFVYMDLDVKKGNDGYKSLADYLEVDRDSLEFMTYAVVTPSGGMHMYFKADKVYGNRTHVLDGVDVRADGGHVLAPGSTIYTLDQDTFDYVEKAYSVVNDMPVADVPEGIKTLLREGLERSERAQVSLVEGALDHPAAIDHMRNLLKTRKPAVQGQGGDEHTLVTIYQVRDHDISDEACIQLLTEEGGWNDRCDPPWDYEELKVKVENAYKYAKRPPGNKGGALLEMGMESGDSELTTDSILPKDLFDEAGEVLEIAPTKSNVNKFMGHLFNANEFMALDIEYNFVVDGWVPDAGYTAMLAKRGGGKTTAIMDMVCHVANDMDWWGTPVEHGYSIVYISGEDTPGVKARLQAWCMKHLKQESMPNPSRFMIFDMTIDLVNAQEVSDYAKFIDEQTKHLRKVIFVVDTWQRMTARSKGQSDEEDMQKAVHNLEGLCKAFKGPSIIAVHPPSGNALKVSGSMVIENNSQAIIHIGDNEAGIRKIETGRVKGAPEGLVKRMKIVSQNISGFTKRGRRMTGALFEYHGGTVGESRDLDVSDNELKMLQLVAEMIVRGKEYDPEHAKDTVNMGDIAKRVFELYDTKGQKGGKWGVKWYEDLKVIGYTDPEILGVDRSGFRPARSPVLRQLHDLRARYNDEVDLKDGKVLNFKQGAGRAVNITIGRKARIEDLPPDQTGGEPTDEGDNF